MVNNNKLVLSSLGHTWILDLDGTLVKHNGYKIDGYDTFLPGAKDFIEKIPTQDMVIILTSRKEQYRKITEKFLHDNDVRYDHIIFEAPYGERLLLNDNKPSGLLMGYAVCGNRDKALDIEYKVDECL